MRQVRLMLILNRQIHQHQAVVRQQVRRTINRLSNDYDRYSSLNENLQSKIAT